jgi:hypothetical protein
MFTKTKLALAAALILGAASAGQAANENDQGNDSGGFRTGPMGQHFRGVNPVYHRSLRHAYRYRFEDGAYAFAPGYPMRHSRHWDWR